jgi:hypothetical protein
MLNSGFSSFSMSVLRATPLILRFFLLALVVAAAVHFVFASDALRIGVFFTFVLTLSFFLSIDVRNRRQRGCRPHLLRHGHVRRRRALLPAPDQQAI